MPVYDRFEPALDVSVPWAYALVPGDTAAVRLLRLHGVTVSLLTAPCRAGAERFAIDSTVLAPRPFQNRRQVRLEGRWIPGDGVTAAGSYLVRTAQSLGVLAVYLLDPLSDDGLTAWDIAGRATANAPTLGAVRLAAAPARACAMGPVP